MMPKGLFTQIAILVIAIGVVVAYVVPKFEEIAETQDTIGIYEEEREKVVSVNSQLSSLQSRMEAVSVDDMRRLNTYTPESVDHIAVQRDLKYIIEQSDASYIAVAFAGESSSDRDSNQDEEGVDEATVSVTPPSAQYDFSFEAEGSYEQLKDLFSDMERNNYPLDFTTVTIQQLPGGFMSVSGTVSTYAFGEVETEEDDSIDL